MGLGWTEFDIWPNSKANTAPIFGLENAKEAAYPFYVKIHYMGAIRTTTGSMYLVEVNGHRILLECGLYPGRREESIRRNREFSFDPTTLDAVVLSHAHIDHAGNLPNLCRKGYQGNIYSTFATRDLCAVMLEDSARVQ